MIFLHVSRDARLVERHTPNFVPEICLFTWLTRNVTQTPLSKVIQKSDGLKLRYSKASTTLPVHLPVNRFAGQGVSVQGTYMSPIKFLLPFEGVRVVLLGRQ